MSLRKELGKIKSIDLTIEDKPYVIVTLEGPGWGVCSHLVVNDIVKPMQDANRDRLSSMKNVPVEAVFEWSILVSWRVLTEVL